MSPLRLAHWHPDHIDELARLANDRAVSRNLRDTFPYPYTRADAAAWVALHPKRGDRPLHYAFEVGDRLVGGGGFVPREEPGTDVERSTTAEIGYWVGQPYWNRGYGREAVRQLTRAARDLGFGRLEARVYDWNPASARVLEKNDYQLERRIKGEARREGRIGDILVYAFRVDS